MIKNKETKKTQNKTIEVIFTFFYYFSLDLILNSSLFYVKTDVEELCHVNYDLFGCDFWRNSWVQSSFSKFKQ